MTKGNRQPFMSVVWKEACMSENVKKLAERATLRRAKTFKSMLLRGMHDFHIARVC